MPLKCATWAGIADIWPLKFRGNVRLNVQQRSPFTRNILNKWCDPGTSVATSEYVGDLFRVFLN